jgi:hypothetical protein
MIFKQHTLDATAAGRVTLAFRRWRRPTVRAGGTLVTAVGVLAIDRVDRVEEPEISEADARRAGWETRDDLLGELNARPEGVLYRIEVRLRGADPRIALRERTALSAEERASLRARVARLDAVSGRGSWTRDVLRAIAEHPGRRAADLAAAMGEETQTFKARVRKLKALGLTESLEVGYRLSPRGRVFLELSSLAP